MREKILAKLTEKFAGLPKNFLGLWADKLATKVTEESQIEGVVNELDKLPVTLQELAAELQKEGDRRVAEAKKPQPKTPEPAKKGDEGSNQQPPADDTPAWAKALMEEVKTLKTEKQQQTIQAKLNEKLKGVPPVFFKGRVPDSEDKIETVAAEILADYTAFQQDSINAGLENGKRPATGGAGVNPSKQAVLKDIDEWVPQGKVAKEAAAK
jgi:hypothetical protein